MGIRWFSINLSLNGNQIFNGYFSVDDTSNLIISFYETLNGSTNFNNNILGPPTEPWDSPDNLFIIDDYSFTDNGVNITSISLKNAFPQVPNQYFNLYGKYVVWHKPFLDEPVDGVIKEISNPKNKHIDNCPIKKSYKIRVLLKKMKNTFIN
jgi:hypothetical protein